VKRSTVIMISEEWKRSGCSPIKVEATGEISQDICQVQTEECKAHWGAPVTTVVVIPTDRSTAGPLDRVLVCGGCLHRKIDTGDWAIELVRPRVSTR
jgi:hypothetical protein